MLYFLSFKDRSTKIRAIYPKFTTPTLSALAFKLTACIRCPYLSSNIALRFKTRTLHFKKIWHLLPRVLPFVVVIGSLVLVWKICHTDTQGDLWKLFDHIRRQSLFGVLIPGSVWGFKEDGRWRVCESSAGREPWRWRDRLCNFHLRRGRHGRPLVWLRPRYLG